MLEYTMVGVGVEIRSGYSGCASNLLEKASDFRKILIPIWSNRCSPKFRAYGMSHLLSSNAHQRALSVFLIRLCITANPKLLDDRNSFTLLFPTKSQLLQLSYGITLAA
jgi:hypothetical protein